ncbi:hypothetical protein GCM10022267_79410 [Lentzea roselyniae]|uniref:Uncharacterized protein n=1 Tax=Lentzea roselyniae TaxID=531940 RepID=A0ABP7C5L1_9PSEU
MMIQQSVTLDITVILQKPGAAALAVPARLYCDHTAPDVVIASFVTERQHVKLQFSRDRLQDRWLAACGIRGTGIDAGVIAFNEEPHISLELNAPIGTVRCLAPVGDIADFLDRTDDLVRPAA